LEVHSFLGGAFFLHLIKNKMIKLTKERLSNKFKTVANNQYVITNVNGIALYLCDNISRLIDHDDVVEIQNLLFLSSLLGTCIYEIRGYEAYRLYYICKSYGFDIEDFTKSIQEN
jgi:hypothetical protein